MNNVSYRVMYLNHSGIKGMKWGVRRYQNRDGTLTEEGKQRYRTVQNFERQRQIKKDRRKRIAKDLAYAAAKTALKTAVASGMVALGAAAALPALNMFATITMRSYNGTPRYFFERITPGDWPASVTNTIANIQQYDWLAPYLP